LEEVFVLKISCIITNRPKVHKRCQDDQYNGARNNDTQHNNVGDINHVIPSDLMPNCNMQIVALLRVVILNVIMLSVAMLSVVMLSLARMLGTIMISLVKLC